MVEPQTSSNKMTELKYYILAYLILNWDELSDTVQHLRFLTTSKTTEELVVELKQLEERAKQTE